jgi:hypothetical protein
LIIQPTNRDGLNYNFIKLKTQTKIHLISGLGADKRTFEKLQLNPIFEQNHIDWINPMPSESIEQYAKRLIELHKISDGDIILGLSFGGIIAVEMNKLLSPGLTILISSVSTEKELPVSFKLIGKLGLHKLVSRKKLIKPNPVNYYVFGTETEEQKGLLDRIISEADPDFTRWAIDVMLRWKNEAKSDNLVKLHGDNDKIFPIKKTFADYIIKGGAHLMVHNRAEEISEILNQLLENHLKATNH